MVLKMLSYRNQYGFQITLNGVSKYATMYPVPEVQWNIKLKTSCIVPILYSQIT